MPSLPHQQPFHEPVGLSPEEHTITRSRILTFMLIVASLVAGLVALLRLTA